MTSDGVPLCVIKSPGDGAFYNSTPLCSVFFQAADIRSASLDAYDREWHLHQNTWLDDKIVLWLPILEKLKCGGKIHISGLMRYCNGRRVLATFQFYWYYITVRHHFGTGSFPLLHSCWAELIHLAAALLISGKSSLLLSLELGLPVCRSWMLQHPLLVPLTLPTPLQIIRFAILSL